MRNLEVRQRNRSYPAFTAWRPFVQWMRRNRGGNVQVLLLLTEMRSGSTWMSSLTNSTGRLGKCAEWINGRKRQEVATRCGDDHFESVIKAAATPNSVAAIKIFPSHLRSLRKQFGYDFIARSLASHDTHVVLVERNDRISQAISIVMAEQTGRWGLPHEDVKDFFRAFLPRRVNSAEEPVYDEQRIQDRFVFVGESMAFWRNYLALNEIRYHTVQYEDVLQSPRTYVQTIASRLGVEIDTETIEIGLYAIQRARLNAEWRERFIGGLRSRDAEFLYSPFRRYPRTLENFLRLVAKRPLVHGSVNPRESTL